MNRIARFAEYAIDNIPIETTLCLAVALISHIFFRSIAKWVVPVAVVCWGTQLVINSNYWHNQPLMIEMQKTIYHWKKQTAITRLIFCISCAALIVFMALSKPLACTLACLMGISWIIYKSSRPGSLLPRRNING